MNRSILLFLSASSLLVGCYNEDKFADDYATASCDNLAGCEADIVQAYVDLGMDEATAQSTYDTTYTAACETEAEDDGEDGEDECDFNSDEAQTCVDEVAAMSCDFWSTGVGYPESCSAVCGE